MQTDSPVTTWSTRSTWPHGSLVGLASIGLLFFLVLPASADPGDARKGADGQSTSGKTAARKAPARPQAVTPEREAAARTFVQQHHPELVALLDHLHANEPKQYQRAVRELFRASERLAQFREQDEDRYTLELETWKVKSRIQLLLARMQMSPAPALRKQLEKTLLQQVDLKIQLLERERRRAAERTEKITAQIQRLKSGRREGVQRELEKLTGSQTKSTPKNSPAKGRPVPASKTTPATTSPTVGAAKSAAKS